MSKKLFVGNLPFSVSEDDLKNLFSGLGEIESIALITDKMTGRSRGFGFVEMTNDEEASKAVESLNGKEIDGRAIVVNEARPMEQRSTSRPPYRGDRGGDRGRFSRGGGGRRSDW